jgi:hypothetical protein
VNWKGASQERLNLLSMGTFISSPAISTE